MPDGTMPSILETQPHRAIGPFEGPVAEYLSAATSPARKAELDSKVKDMVEKAQIVVGPLTETLLAEAVTTVPKDKREDPEAVAKVLHDAVEDSDSWRLRIQQAVQEARVRNETKDAADAYSPQVYREFIKRQFENAAKDAVGPEPTPTLPGEIHYDAWDYLPRFGQEVENTQLNPRVSRPARIPLPGQQITDEFLAGAAAGLAADSIRENLAVIKERRSKDKYDNLPYETLREALSSGKLNGEDLSAGEMKALKRSQQNRYGEAKSYGLFDATMTKSLREALVATEWERGKYINDLLAFADQQEAQAERLAGYRGNERLTGIVRDGIAGVIEIAKYDGMLKATAEEKTRYGFTPQAIQDQKRLADQSFWQPFGLNYKELIDQETPDQQRQREARVAVAAVTPAQNNSATPEALKAALSDVFGTGETTGSVESRKANIFEKTITQIEPKNLSDLNWIVGDAEAQVMPVTMRLRTFNEQYSFEECLHAYLQEKPEELNELIRLWHQRKNTVLPKDVKFQTPMSVVEKILALGGTPHGVDKYNSMAESYPDFIRGGRDAVLDSLWSRLPIGSDGRPSEVTLSTYLDAGDGQGFMTALNNIKAQSFKDEWDRVKFIDTWMKVTKSTLKNYTPDIIDWVSLPSARTLVMFQALQKDLPIRQDKRILSATDIRKMFGAFGLDGYLINSGSRLILQAQPGAGYAVVLGRDKKQK